MRIELRTPPVASTKILGKSGRHRLGANNKPSCLEQEEYEERTAVGFHLERLTKDVSRLATSATELA
jgi:hypothetical protein